MRIVNLQNICSITWYITTARVYTIYYTKQRNVRVFLEQTVIIKLEKSDPFVHSAWLTLITGTQSATYLIPSLILDGEIRREEVRRDA